MKPIAVIFLVVVILVIAALIGLSIYYDVKKTPTPSSIPELLGFKYTKPEDKPTIKEHFGLQPAEYMGIAIGSIFLFTIIVYGLFIFLPNSGQSY